MLFQRQALLLITFIALCDPLVAAPSCTSIFANKIQGLFSEGLAHAKSEISLMLESNFFNTERTLYEYNDNLSGFEEALDGLPSNGVWYDFGAGSAYAIREHARKEWVINQKLYAVGVTIPIETVIERSFEIDFSRPNLKYIEDYVEDIPFGNLPKADLITDFAGPITYSDELSKVLQLTLNQLNIGGKFIFYYFTKFHKIKVGYFSSIDLEEFIETYVKGIKVVHKDKSRGGGTASFHLERTGDIVVPELELVKVRTNRLPDWTYRLK